MTRKVDGMLRQLSALKNYVEDLAESLTDTQAVALQATINTAWEILDRRTEKRRIQ